MLAKYYKFVKHNYIKILLFSIHRGIVKAFNLLIA